MYHSLNHDVGDLLCLNNFHYVEAFVPRIVVVVEDDFIKYISAAEFL